MSGTKLKGMDLTTCQIDGMEIDIEDLREGGVSYAYYYFPCKDNGGRQ